ncbi:hypothetical protein CLV51_106185 [Chitinophaga niastensis]|uniref:Uncharacterized protein n=1 Tax=Chitinophaga niastensis TaxID=536980 RepID=A0A2P8HDL7_CHINA|nr:hypothetical protein CLV51_106185 [Chitinophaga niastensis]
MLPLSDFSLMEDIPGMFRNYSYITTTEEFGVIDFIGDYLLHGKEMFDHNKHDKPQNNDNSVQFQHQANPLNVVFLYRSLTLTSIPEYPKKYPLSKESFHTSGYRDKLFRPPLA